jgi:hypothetical protein
MGDVRIDAEALAMTKHVLERMIVEHREQLAEIERLNTDLAAANAALASVTDLLDEARTERDEARAVVDTCHEYSLGLARDLGDVRAELATMTQITVLQAGEVNDLRAELTEARAELAEHMSPECQHVNAHDGCDETVVCRNRCWCRCHWAPPPATDPAVTNATAVVAQVPRLTDAEIEASDWDRETS